MRPDLSKARPTDLRPLVVRTSGNATQGVYGLVLATSVIAVSAGYAPSDAGRIALEVLATAAVFSLVHLYAAVLGGAVSTERALTRGSVAYALRESWSLVEVAIPLVIILGLGAIGVVGDRTAILAATLVALMEMVATGAYAAIRHGAGTRGRIASGASALALGLLTVGLEALLH